MLEIPIDFNAIDELFRRAEEDGRQCLYEYETYDLLRYSGAESPPLTHFIPKRARPSNEELNAMPGELVVMKIVSPTIVHKTEVGGVKIIEKQPGKIRSTWRRMIDEVPENYTRWIEQNRSQAPDKYRNLEGEALFKAVAQDIKGVLMCQYMPPDSTAFGNELLVSIRRTREFGMMITAGLGGTDTELYAQRFKKGKAVISSSTHMTDGETFFQLFKDTIAYEKFSGKTRGQGRIISDDQLIECFTSFIKIAEHYSPLNPEAPFIIEELEINPFAFSDYQMVPLDGMCRFSRPSPLPIARPIEKIDRLLHPKSIAIIGVSFKRRNFGRIILENIIASGFDRSKITIIKEGVSSFEGVKCLPSLEMLKPKVDLFVVAIKSEQVPDVIDEIIDKDLAESVLLVSGGLGEKKGSEDRAKEIARRINEAHQRPDGGPIFLGSNCMGVVSYPGQFDTIFIPEEKLPKLRGTHRRNSAFISQSGAFIITRMSKIPHLDPAYVLSIGNQNDLTAGDIVSYIKDRDDIDVIAIYMEGFKDYDGLALCRAIREAVLKGKEVVFYKAGRTEEGKSATSGHTASIAGDYMVCESCVSQAGAMVAETFTQFENLYSLATLIHNKKINGNRLAAVSGAGFEAVGMADNIRGEGYRMQMATFSPSTVQHLQALVEKNGLQDLVDVKNPMDINPAANDEMHAKIIEILTEDDGVDGIVIGLDPLSPATKTLPPKNDDLEEGPKFAITLLLEELHQRLTKPVICVVDGGKLYDPMVEDLESFKIPVFRASDQAVAALAKYITARLYANQMRKKYNAPTL